MNIRIEEAFHDCFERMLSGESLESCLSRYPQYAAELDSMLRTSYDVKRKAYPIQPRPEFKYWARVRMQNAQIYGVQKTVADRPVSSNLRRNLAISLAALLVFTIASSGTAAASSDAMPDEPLYGVKLVVEQARVTLAPTETDKAEIYAQLTEKRAQEIAVMASKGNDEKVISTTKIMNYQLQQLEDKMAKFEAEYAADQARVSNAAATASQPKPFTAVVPPAATSTTVTPPAATGTVVVPPAATTTTATPPAATSTTVVPPATTSITVTPPAVPSTTGVPPAATGTASITSSATANATRKFTLPTTVNDNQTTAGSDNQTTAAAGQNNRDAQRILNIKKARETINNSTAKSLTILQSALDKAPDSVKSSLNSAINETMTTNKRIQLENNRNSGIIKRGGQNTDSDNDTDLDNDNDNGKPATDPTIKPNVNKNPVNNPSDHQKNKMNYNTDAKVVR
jgi:hypothetical protein